MVQDTDKKNIAKSFSDRRSHDPAGKRSEHSNSKKQLAFKHSALKMGGNCFLEKKRCRLCPNPEVGRRDQHL